MNDQQWQRVSPWAILYFIVHFALRFIKDGLLNLLPILVLFVTQVEQKMFWGQVAASVASIFLMLYAFAYYRNFKYRITDGNEILLNKGVFKKERLTLKFARVQNVNIAEPFYFQPVNLVNCIFDAAGSSAQEAVIPGVKLSYAEHVREQVMAFKAQLEQQDQPPIEQSEAVDKSHTLTISNAEIAKFGLMSNMAILALAALAPFMNVILEYLEKNIINRLEAILNEQAAFVGSAAAIAVLIMVVAIVLCAILLSVVMALVRFFNFKLYFQDDKFKRVAGLFERQQLSISVLKIQSVQIKQNIIARLLNRFTLICPQVSSGGIAAGVAAHKNKQTFVMPVLTKEQVQTVCRWLFPWFVDLTELHFIKPERALLYKNTLLYVLLPTIVSALIFNALFNATMMLWSILVALLLMIGVFLSYQKTGMAMYEHDGRFFAVFKTGMLGIQYRVFEIYKAQSVTTTSTYLMRRSQLKTLYIQLASGSVSMPYLKAIEADQFIDFVLYEVEGVERSWF
ncbi:MAG: stress protein [Pseudoalteromonadaceae bacterium]|nr:stress protein [Pseudoalteromonadaceae bacterium]|tara:strand:- start:3197 stop:4729 length:1533 start_codon:yes stop_codon:yes gene_type:complete